MPEQESIQMLEKEIRALEEKLAVQKRLEAEKGEVAREEKEIFRDVLKEHVERAKTETQPSPPIASPMPATPPHDYTAQRRNTANELKEKEHHEQIEALVTIALTKGVMEAVSVARHLGNPHLLDDFHDALVDDYYEKLLQAREISP